MASADSACVACKSKKRKCDKALPQCGLCTRTGGFCAYVDPGLAPARSIASIASIENRGHFEPGASPFYHEHALTYTPPTVSPRRGLALQPVRASSNGSFPSALLLDVDCFHRMGLQLSQPSINIPMKTLAILNRGNTAVDASDAYFKTVHRWLPFISKKRIDLGATLHNGGPDLAMLFLAM
ncbi:hypothetical protein WHR41_06760 [Cladosporium halotolerans]|uniref:Zn(2)-C6 fungal-type domain-containing protein n=1 Tax=Cladosporium halotolerans TaxID=1052096 RepID=A0AB34KKG8_9PEZI